ncbi:MAG: QueT transporter family protein [Eubacteriales bacterium]|nr:QueT transporter family protein [Eubacteriales bacterium]
MNFHVKSLARAGMIAAIYAALTLIFAPISFNAVQFRISEAMTVLPMLLPEAVPGLAVGCLVANILGGAALPDVIGGTLATLIAAILTRILRKKPVLAMASPVVINGLIVGPLVYFCYEYQSVFSLGALGFTVFTVALGEAVVVAVLGTLLIKALPKIKWKR